ncbi:YjbF family lipoprotein [Pseudooctadecabacter sp.]|uniref:YjbF family lipoprotein n=1 Tax=Pseudooctadecabacter sp. TaxID=1966338 RepID=UPI0035C80A23
MALISKILGVGLIASLAACGPLGEGVTSSTLKGVAGAVLGGADTAAGQQAASQPQAGLTRAAIEATDADLLLVSLVSRGSVDVMSQIAARSGAVTWISTDGVSVSVSNGMVVGTRGSGFDLMGAETAAARRSLSGGGTHTRSYDVLTGLDQIENSTYACETVFDKSETITIVERDYATQKWKEFCENESVRFTNLYWTTSDGTIVQTRQFISIGLGYLVYQRL